MSKKAIAHLSKDKRLKVLIKNTTLRPRTFGGGVYENLIRSIVSQQLSVKVAETIHKRFLDLFEHQYPVPRQLIAMDIETLRSAGLSRPKAGYIQNVAQFFMTKNLLDKDWSTINNETIINQLTAIKGVGKWTVQMILIFTLERPDIFPIDDLGVRNGVIQLYELEGKYSKSSADQKALREKIASLTDSWSPYRTLASLYLWELTTKV